VIAAETIGDWEGEAPAEPRTFRDSPYADLPRGSSARRKIGSPWLVRLPDDDVPILLAGNTVCRNDRDDYHAPTSRIPTERDLGHRTP
jgi:hypothetical protein